MRGKRVKEDRIIAILQEAEAGVSILDIPMFSGQDGWNNGNSGQTVSKHIKEYSMGTIHSIG